MTSREFFLQTLKEEAPKFKVIIEALPDDKKDYKVHERSRTAGNLAAQLGVQWKACSGIVTTGQAAFDPHEMENQDKATILSNLEQGVAQLEKDVAAMSDEEWENGGAGWGGQFNNTKGRMTWSFMFDAIHHRGQLMTFLRAMGAKVPGIYGPSADSE